MVIEEDKLNWELNEQDKEKQDEKEMPDKDKQDENVTDKEMHKDDIEPFNEDFVQIVISNKK